MNNNCLNRTFSGRILFSFVLLSISFLFLLNCSSMQPEMRLAQHWIDFEGESYRLRSIKSLDASKAYNELIGKDFVAIDFDQDRFIDKIALGEVEIAKAQRIYEHSLSMLSQENMVQEIQIIVNQFNEENTDYSYELKSFTTVNAEPFNAFKIINKAFSNGHSVTIYIDRGADGELDELLKGSMEMVEAQERYDRIIKSGLRKKQLVEVENSIIVSKR